MGLNQNIYFTVACGASNANPLTGDANVVIAMNRTRASARLHLPSIILDLRAGRGLGPLCAEHLLARVVPHRPPLGSLAAQPTEYAARKWIICCHTTLETWGRRSEGAYLLGAGYKGGQETAGGVRRTACDARWRSRSGAPRFSDRVANWVKLYMYTVHEQGSSACR